MQYVPAKGVYVYFRYDDKQTILCALNADTLSTVLNFSDYAERTKGFTSATDILTGHIFPISEKMNLPARSMQILELKNRPDANKVVH